MDYLQGLSHSIVAKVQSLNPSSLILTGLAILLSWTVLSYFNTETWKLRHFPTVGSTLPLLSLFGAIKFTTDPHGFVTTGRRKWPGRIFKVPDLTEWILVVADPVLISDVRKAPDHLLSSMNALDESLQVRFTMGSQITENPLHIPIIRNQLTKAIPALILDLYDDVSEAFNQYLPAKEWTRVIALENMTKIVARVSNRAFVGPQLCRNPDWNKITIDFTMDVVKTSLLLRAFPPFLRPFLNYIAGNRKAKGNRAAAKFLGPVIAARRIERENGTNNSNDFLSWLMDNAEGEEKEDWALVARILVLNFAAIHTTSMALTQALFDLASKPEYLKPLREEVEEVIKREGWSKAGLDHMHKVDSFTKESQRLHPIGVLMLQRCALVDYTFSDGTTVPAGTLVAVPSSSVHLDADIYEDPLKFDGFRFVKMKARAGLDGDSDKKFDIVTSSAEFVAFGQGRHACPGRFFASAELKILLAYIITNYDVKVDGDIRPPDFHFMKGTTPNPTAMIYFRRRQ